MKLLLGRLLFIVALGGTASASAQDWEREWSRIWGSASNDLGQAVAATPGGTVYVAGIATNGFDGQTNNGVLNAFLSCFNANGEKQWTRIFGATNYTEGYAVAVDATGAVYVAGMTWAGFDGEAAIGNGDAFLTKFSASGNKEWSRIFGSTRIDSAKGIAVDASNYVYVCGYCRTNFDGQTAIGGRDLFYSKYSPAGVRDHSRIWGSTSDDYAQSIAVDVQNHVFVAGYTSAAFDGQPFGGSTDACLSLFKDGTKLWSRLWGGTGVNYAYGVAVDGLGNAYVTGYGGPFGGQQQIGDTDVFLCRYNELGTLAWARIWGSIWGDAGYGVAVAGPDDIFVTGLAAWGATFDGQTNKYETAFLSAFHADGSRPWTRRWGAGSSEGHGVAAPATNLVFVAGSTYGAFDDQPFLGEYDAFLSRWSPYAPPRIVWGPVAGKIMRHEVEISWRTDRSCDSQVWYGQDSDSFSDGTTNPALVTSHTVMLTNLEADTTYRYRVRSTDSRSSTVSSGDDYFETLPEAGGSLVISNLEVFGGAIFPMQIAFDHTGDIRRVEYFLGSRLIFTDFSPPFAGVMYPEWLGLTPADLVGTQQVSAVAYGLDGSTSMCAVDMSFLADAADLIDVEIQQPSDELTIYTTNAVSPSTNLACRIWARQKDYIPHRPTGDIGPGMPIKFDETYNPVTQVVVKLDSALLGLATNHAVDGSSLAWGYAYNPAGLPTGRYRLSAEALSSNVIRYADSIYFNIVNGLPDLVYERDIEQRSNYFVVTLTVRNDGGNSARLDEVTDRLQSLQPTLAECAAARATNYLYHVDDRWAQVQFLFPDGVELDPGEEIVLTYHAVPVLHVEAMPALIGGPDSYIKYRDWLGNPHEERMNRLERMAHLQGSAEEISLSDAVSAIKLASDYLIVSNPNNLIGLYGDGGGNRVLVAMANLAMLRNAVLGYTYAYQSMTTKFQRGDLIGMGNVFKDWRDELVVADSHEQRLRVYNGTTELTLVSNRLPFARRFYAGDGMGVGNLVPKIVTNDHDRAEVAIVNGGSGTGVVGQVDIYVYLPEFEQFDVYHRQTPYSNGCAFAVANVYPNAGGAADMLVVETNGTLNVYADLGAVPVVTQHIAFRGGHEIRTGDLLGNSSEEVLAVRKDESRSWIYSYRNPVARFDSFAWDVEFEPNDDVAIGDVWGDEKAEILVAREADNRVDVYGFNAVSNRVELLRQLDFAFYAGDRLTAGFLLYAAKEQLVFLRGATHDEYARGKADILIYTGRRGAATAAGLDGLLNVGGGWARQLSPSWVSNGYLLIVGETEIIPTFSTSWDLTGSSGGRVDYTDRNFASTGRDENNKPELSMGRIIGNSSDDLLIPLDTAIRFGPYLNNTNDAAGPLLLIGYDRGTDGESDYVNFGETGDLVEEALEDNGGYGAIVRRSTPWIDAPEAYSLIAMRDFVLLSGHGNWNVWDILNTFDMQFETNVTWGTHRPIIYAESCLTGRYPPGRGIAEAFLQRQAGAYIGATANGIGRWCMRMATAFASRLDSDHTVGSALRDAKLHRMSDDAQTYCWDRAYNRYHSAITHLYGDPKCRLWLPSSRRSAAKALPQQEFQGPLDSLQFQVPDYTVYSSNGQDTITIPNGGDVFIPGMPAVPSYSVSVRFPAGSVVQSVDLVSRGNPASSNGLALPIVDTAILGGRNTSPPAPRWVSKTGDWWPDEQFSWSLTPESDGSSTLHITAYPFCHNSKTAESLFYTNYMFNIGHSASDVSIVQLVPDGDSYEPGDTVRVEAYVYGTNAVARDVVARASIRSNNLETVVSLPLKTLSGVQGLATFTLSWDSTGQAVGDYVLDVELTDNQGVVLARRQLEFTLGSTKGKLTQASLDPESFRRGEDVDLSATFENEGSTSLNGVVVIQALRADGTVEAEFRQEFSNLLAGVSFTFGTVWSNATLVPRDCQIVAFALYGGDPTPAVVGYDWQDAPLLLDGIHTQSSNRVLRWPSVAGRTYDVELATNLPSFLSFTNVPASAPQNTFTDLPPESVLFYRVRERP